MSKPVSDERAGELRAIIGDPAALARELTEYSCSARSFSERAQEFKEKYPQNWVALHGDQVVAASSFEEVVRLLDEEHIPRENTIIRFMASTENMHFF